MNKLIRFSIGLLFGVCTANLAVATTTDSTSMRDDYSYSGPELYVGVGIGAIDVDANDFDDDDSVGKGFIGGKFNEYIGAEIGYIDFGKFDNPIASAESDGVTVAVTGWLPVHQRISLFAKGGRLYWDTDVKAPGFRDSFDGKETFWGLGAQFEISEHVDAMLEYDRFKLDLQNSELGLPSGIPTADIESDLNYASLGIQASF